VAFNFSCTQPGPPTRPTPIHTCTAHHEPIPGQEPPLLPCSLVQALGSSRDHTGAAADPPTCGQAVGHPQAAQPARHPGHWEHQPRALALAAPLGHAARAAAAARGGGGAPGRALLAGGRLRAGREWRGASPGPWWLAGWPVAGGP
jgi:hypothetical protein